LFAFNSLRHTDSTQKNKNDKNLKFHDVDVDQLWVKI
jgi:hypothetical protein